MPPAKPKTIPFGSAPIAATSAPKTLPFDAAPIAEPVATPKKNNGFLKDLAIGVTRLPVRAAVNIGVATDAARGIFGNKEAAERSARVEKEGIDSPTYGKIRGIGMTQKGFGRDLLDTAGAGVEAASYIPVARAPAVASQLFKTSLKQGVKTGAREGAVAGTLQSGGQEMQNPEADAGTILKESLKGTALGGAGGAVLGGAVPSVPALGKSAQRVIQRNSPDVISQKIASDFSKSIKPLFPGATKGQLEKKTKQTVEAVKLMQENVPNLKFVDDLGETITGRAPKSVFELSDALDQTKKKVFNAYSVLPKAAGEKGLSVNPASISTELEKITGKFDPITKEFDGESANKALQLSNPEAVAYARTIADRYRNIGDLDPEVVQDVIKNLNESLKAFYRNPTYTDASRAAIDAMVANNLRKALDEGVEKLTGVQYQAIKNQYASLKAVEKDIVRAAAREAKKGAKGLIDFTDIFTGADILQGVLTLNPGAIARGTVGRGIKEVYKYLNDPNRAIEKMFKNAEKLPSKALFNK